MLLIDYVFECVAIFLDNKYQPVGFLNCKNKGSLKMCYLVAIKSFSHHDHWATQMMDVAAATRR